MPKFTKQQRAQILAEAHRHLAVRRAEFQRRKKALLLQKQKMIESRREREPQQVTKTDRKTLLGFIATLKSVIRALEGGNHGFNGKQN
ncbi:hypothetical protein G6321_00011870 [Bradyrhizobium barranii subsp. barranii]|uniref:Uncharacterized protein n=1 Tax=Bradyrhizobium barranii subsp. barranii TaxID=2823807 RepID=A0A7Z0Q5B2_9BRAD|nr:hypothetical protein [Bradyrhizobium barranii]UGX95788.1 hypothetical protein G6321_00011870 [Bradyrhizobium barranii subsp. barranii]